MAHMTALGHRMEHTDVSTAFLNADLQEDIYMYPPDGVEVGEGMCYLLHKSLYGLKQSGRNWNIDIVAFFASIGLTQCESDPCLFFKITPDGTLHALIYVDDIVTGGPDKLLDWFHVQLSNKYRVVREDLNWVLGIEVTHPTQDTLKISQGAFVRSLLQKYKMDDCNAVRTPMEEGSKLSKAEQPQTQAEALEMKQYPYRALIGSLLYLSVCTRPDISFAVGVLARFCENPGLPHWHAAKRVLRYLKGTEDAGIIYGRSTHNVFGYSDADFGGELDKRRSTSAYAFLMHGGVVAWRSKLQDCTAGSTVEAEYVALAQATREALFLTKLLTDFQVTDTKPVIIYEDNNGAIQLAHNPVNHSRVKHIDISYNVTRQRVQTGEIDVVRIGTHDMTADTLTKPLGATLFQKHRAGLGVFL
jgi:hypothetical protein